MERIEDRTYQFALRIVKMVRAMPRDAASQIMARQVMCSWTSIGANIEEAIAGTSKRDFANKMNIAQKEARETYYWLKLIRDCDIIPSNRIAPLVQEALEITKILSKTVTTARKNLASATQREKDMS